MLEYLNCYKISSFKKLDITLPGSKSISNRLLILKSLFSSNVEIKNLSEANDTVLLDNILNEIETVTQEEYFFNVENSGTAIRFLTAYLSQKQGVFVLNCSKEMKRRPIAYLVNALKSIGANIQYLERDGYPPIKIVGENLLYNRVTVKASLSSQYISAVLMISAMQKNDVEIIFEHKPISEPYIDMTISIMEQFGVSLIKNKNGIIVKKDKLTYQKTFFVESDWSATAVWYAFATLLENFDIEMKYLFSNSLQGDSILSEIYKMFGIESIFEQNSLKIRKISKPMIDYFEMDMSPYPDIVPTLAINLCLLDIPFRIKNIENLIIKECNRVEAIQNIAQKMGFILEFFENSLIWNKVKINNLHKNVILNTYNDHRIVMAASLFSTLNDVKIENPSAVGKSYPNFWEHYKSIFA